MKYYKLKFREYDNKKVLMKYIYENGKSDITKESLKYEYDDFFKKYGILICIKKLDNKKVLTEYIYDKNGKSDSTKEYDKEGKLIYWLKYIYGDYFNLKYIKKYDKYDKLIISYDF